MTPAVRTYDVKTWRRTVLASDLPLASKVVALVLYEHMDWDGDEAGGNCWPSLVSLAEESGMARRSVIRAVQVLVDEGWIHRRCRRGCEDCKGGNGHVANYASLLPQQGHDVTAEECHDVTADEGAGENEQCHDVTDNGDNGASNGDNGASQRCHDVTGPSSTYLNLSRDLPGAAPSALPPDGGGWSKRSQKQDELRNEIATAEYGVLFKDASPLQRNLVDDKVRERLQGVAS